MTANYHTDFGELTDLIVSYKKKSPFFAFRNFLFYTLQINRRREKC